METVTTVWNVLKVALGLGFVIFLHELGHFLLAKWNGVKVEKFSIGFGPTLASFRWGVGLRIGTGSRPPGPGDPPSWGETEYILAALPLGGYVKMLGESPEESTEEAEKSADPRAYHNKTVWARMQIITAGVIMNVLLGLACFTFVFTQEMLEKPAKVGGVLPGAPAYKAGLRPGDEIVALDGRRNITFTQLLQKVNFSGPGQKVQFTIRREGAEGEQTLEIEPLRDETGQVPTIGIHDTASLELLSEVPFRALPGQEVDKSKPDGGFRGDDKVVAVGPEDGPLLPVLDYADFIRKIEPLRSKPMVVEVERKTPTKEGEAKKEKASEVKTLEKITVPPHRFVDFGLRLEAGPIVAVRNDSPAHRAGFQANDRIVAVNGRKDYDPMGLPEKARESAGQTMTFTVERPVEGKPATTIDIPVKPDATPAWIEMVDTSGRLLPLDIPGLGLAIAVGPKVEAVADNSPASRAKLKPGDVLRSLTFTPAKMDREKTNPKPITIKLDGKVSGWPMAFSALQTRPWTSVEILVNNSDKPITIKPEADPNRSHPLRGLRFQALLIKMPPLGLADAFRRGIDDTYDNIANVFTVFQRLAQRRVGHDAMGGVIPIAQFAYSAADSGWTPFIHFLGILSINLAVLNFLPIPPLDGGQFAFLAAEKIRGRPLPEAALNIVTIAGVIFVLGLILLINGRDIYRLILSYF